jgi:hypothetical protein
MLLSLGIGSQIGIMEGMIGTFFDVPQLKHIKKPILTGKSLDLGMFKLIKSTGQKCLQP